MNVATTVPSSIWSRWIPIVNLFFFLISLLLVFGYDLYLVITREESARGLGISPDDVKFFWMIMLVPFVIFLGFFLLEQIKYKKQFSQSTANGIDVALLLIIIIRNAILVLNFIPVIQLLGLAAGVFGGWLVIIIYFVLIHYRYRSIRGLALPNRTY